MLTRGSSPVPETYTYMNMTMKSVRDVRSGRAGGAAVTRSVAIAAAVLVAGFAPRPAAGQEERPVTLQEALAEARRGSPEGAVAQARAEAARQAVRQAGSYLWPQVAVDGGVVRSTDPVAAFGARLRQGRFTEADFDPTALNRPDPLDDWSAGVGALWRPVDRAAEEGRRAARAEAEGAERTAAWTERSVAYATRVQYVQAVAADRRTRAAEAALQAAEGNETRVALRAGEGVLTEADVLRARAAVEEARAAVVDARRAVADARDRLAVTLGWPVGVTPIPTDTTFAEPSVDAGVSGGVPEGRPDLEASARSVAAAAARVSRASAARLPTLEGMARYGTHGRDVLDGHRSNWTLGLQVSVPVFTGFAVEAGRAAAVASHDAALRVHERRRRGGAPGPPPVRGGAGHHVRPVVRRGPGRGATNRIRERHPGAASRRGPGGLPDRTRNRPMNRLVLLAIPLVTLACSSAEPGRMADVPDAVVVEVSAPASGTAGATFPATVVSRRTAEIATRMSGTVERVAVDVGDAVRAGDPLVDLDAGDIAARVRAAEADLAMARRTHGRIERLAGAGAASASELDAAVATLEGAEARLSEARAQEAYAVVRAPFDGVVSRRDVDPGDLAVPGRPLLVLMAPTALDVRADLPAERAGDVRVGAAARVHLTGGGAPVAVRIARVVHALEPGARTFRVEAALPVSAGSVPPGSYARLELAGSGESGRWVPADAVVSRGQLRGVFTVEDDTLRLRWVRLGRSSGDAVELLSGADRGVDVVRRPDPELRDGTPVARAERVPFAGPSDDAPSGPADVGEGA